MLCTIFEDRELSTAPAEPRNPFAGTAERPQPLPESFAGFFETADTLEEAALKLVATRLQA